MKINDTAYDNYKVLMRYSYILFKKNLIRILKNNFKLKKQKLSKGSYYSRNSVNYRKISKFKMHNQTLRMHNKIRALIFPAYQYPVVNGSKVFRSIYKNKKIYLTQ